MNGWIEIVAGTLGAGKTMLGVERSYYHLRDGGHMWTNVKIFPDVVREQMAEHGYEADLSRLNFLDGKSLDDFQSQIARGTADSQVLVLIDEAHLEWNSRDYQTTKSDPKAREMLNFITLVRKLDIILVYVTQSPEDIDKQLRKKASILWMCRNFKNWRLFGIFPFPFPLMSRSCYDISVGNKKPERLSFEFLLRPKWVCRMYDSDALLGKAASKFENLRTVKASPLKRIPKVRKPLSQKTKYAALVASSLASSCAFLLTY